MCCICVSNEGSDNDRLSYDIHNKKINYNIIITIAYDRVFYYVSSPPLFLLLKCSSVDC